MNSGQLGVVSLVVAAHAAIHEINLIPNLKTGDGISYSFYHACPVTPQNQG